MTFDDYITTEALNPETLAKRRGKTYSEMNHIGFSIEAVEKQLKDAEASGVDVKELNDTLKKLRTQYSKLCNKYHRYAK